MWARAESHPPSIHLLYLPFQNPATMTSIPAPLRMATLLGACLAPLLLTSPGRAMSLNEACTTFAAKLSSAQASGDIAKAQKIYTEGNKRIASRFNGASCPEVKAP